MLHLSNTLVNSYNPVIDNHKYEYWTGVFFFIHESLTRTRFRGKSFRRKLSENSQTSLGKTSKAAKGFEIVHRYKAQAL